MTHASIRTCALHGTMHIMSMLHTIPSFSDFMSQINPLRKYDPLATTSRGVESTVWLGQWAGVDYIPLQGEGVCSIVVTGPVSSSPRVTLHAGTVCLRTPLPASK